MNYLSYYRLQYLVKYNLLDEESHFVYFLILKGNDKKDIWWNIFLSFKTNKKRPWFWLAMWLSISVEMPPKLKIQPPLLIMVYVQTFRLLGLGDV